MVHVQGVLKVCRGWCGRGQHESVPGVLQACESLVHFSELLSTGSGRCRLRSGPLYLITPV